METISSWLKQCREERGFSLADIQRITKIRGMYLEALEEGKFSVLPGEAYQRAFIRTYASAIGVDPQPVIARYDNLRREKERMEKAQYAAPPPSAPQRFIRMILSTFNGTMEWLGL